MSEHTPSKSKKPLSGFQRRKLRVERGLPRYTPNEAKRRQEYDNIRARERYLALSAEVDAIKLAHGCTDCGYNKHPAALEFDHLPGTTKLSTVAYLVWSGQRKRTMQEIAKCEVVCANCHAIRTIERRLELEANR